MKKYLSLMLSIVLLLCAVIPVSAETEEYVSSSALDKALIVHYDFEDTDSGALYDKSTGGKSTEWITSKDYITTANGTATVTGSTGAITYLGSTSENTKGADILKNETGEFTFLVTFKASGLETPGKTSIWNNVFNLYKSGANYVRVIVQQDATTQDTVDGKAAMYVLDSDGKATKIHDLEYNKDTFLTFALTMKYNTSSEAWDYLGYISADGGITYSQVYSKSVNATSGFFADASYLSLGNQHADGTAVYTFDDFRIYNKALSLPEIKYEVPGVTGAVLHGVQTSTNVSDTYSVRFVGSIESKDYHEVGFKVTAQSGAYKWDVPAETVFGSLNANTDKGLESYTAKSLRGSDSSYLYALSINNIPTKDNGNDLTVTFIVTPYSIKNEGDTPVPGTSYTIVYKAGVYQSSAVYTAPTT